MTSKMTDLFHTLAQILIAELLAISIGLFVLVYLLKQIRSTKTRLLLGIIVCTGYALSLFSIAAVVAVLTQNAKNEDIPEFRINMAIEAASVSIPVASLLIAGSGVAAGLLQLTNRRN